jgi:hypothetical protein
MLYEILPNALRSNYDPRQNLGPHTDGIIDSTNVKYVDSMKIQLKELSLNQSIGGPTSPMSSTLTQSADVHSVKSSKNPNGNHQPGGNKNKGHGNNRRGGKNNNKPKENDNNEKSNNNVGKAKKERQKVNFPCNICTYDHLTHLCSKLVETARILSLPPLVLTNPFPHNHHMTSSSSNAENVASGSQNPPMQYGDHLCINMVKYEVNVPLGLAITVLHRLYLVNSLPLLQMCPYISKTQIPHLIFSKEYSSSLPIILMLELPRITLLLRIWVKPLLRCQLWRCSRHVLHRGMPFYM